MSNEVFFSTLREPISKTCGDCFETLKDGREVVAHQEGRKIHAFHKECLIERMSPYLSIQDITKAVCPSCYKQVNLNSLGLSVRRPLPLNFFEELISKPRMLSDQIIFGIKSSSSKVFASFKEKSREIFCSRLLKVFAVSSRIFNFIKGKGRNIGIAGLLGCCAILSSTSSQQAAFTATLTFASYLISEAAIDSLSSRMEKTFGPRISLLVESSSLVGLFALFFLNHVKPLISALSSPLNKIDPARFIELGLIFGSATGLATVHSPSPNYIYTIQIKRR